MKFSPIFPKSIFESYKSLNIENPTALSFFDQKINMSQKFLNEFVKRQRLLSDKQKTLLQNIPSDSFHVDEFFKALGFQEHSFLFLNDKKEIFLELSKNLFKNDKPIKKYDLIINNLIISNIYNQFNFLINVHNLTKENGLMLHIVPFSGLINQNLFNINPIFFRQIAIWNNYEAVKISLSNFSGAEVTIPLRKHQIFYEILDSTDEISHFKKLLDFSKEKLGEDIFLIIILKKMNNNDFKFE